MAYYYKWILSLTNFLTRAMHEIIYNNYHELYIVNKISKTIYYKELYYNITKFNIHN